MDKANGEFAKADEGQSRTANPKRRRYYLINLKPQRRYCLNPKDRRWQKPTCYSANLKPSDDMLLGKSPTRNFVGDKPQTAKEDDVTWQTGNL